ncbi:hypothetical protein [Paramagnetospirillum magneticum]|uniref:hypothetical protein n=1 Tax=Paramagnetospirillum magneticum TaxID=84159 RepID=UPI0011D09E85|nr:hypothetical protein [Paramagnetospirillum magneticum]
MNFSNLYTRHKTLIHGQFVDKTWIEFMEAADKFSPAMWDWSFQSIADISSARELSATEEELAINCLVYIFDNIISDINGGAESEWHDYSHLAFVWCSDHDIDMDIDIGKIIISPSDGELPTIVLD